MGARSVNLSLGMWLFLSAFLWPHTNAQQINAWVVGMLSVTAALGGLEGRPRWRYANVVLGLWLIVSTAFLPRTSAATALNHVLVGAGLAAFGLMRRIGHAPGTP